MTTSILPRFSVESARERPTSLGRHVPQDSEIKILIVDDQPANLLALEAVLEGLGHALIMASSGQEALKRVLQDDFAVILMDVYMPGMDGFETAEIIRQRDRCRFTPIIFLTAYGKEETHVSRGYSVGGADYLFKPIVPEILRAKVSAFVDLSLKTAIVARQAQQLQELERQRYQAELLETQRQLQVERHEQDARAARKVQQSLFPRVPPLCPGLDIAGASYPADATGGDYFDYIVTPQGDLDVVIGDVSGHGLGAALLMSSTRAYLRALAMAGMSVEDLLALTNHALTDDLDGSRFVTLFYARLAPDRLSFCYSSAGHQPGYIISSNGDVKAVLDSTAMPMGIFADSEFPAAPAIDLTPGDLLFLFTDGVTEALAPDETLFGCERALQLLREDRGRSAAELIEILHIAVTDFVKRPTLEDDFTTIIIKVGSATMAPCVPR